MERINYHELLEAAVDIIDSKKGEGIIAYDVRDMTSFTDYILIASVNSSSQMGAIIKEFRNNPGLKKSRIEGDASSGWVLIDCEGIVLNLFLPEVREFYSLERLWGEAKEVKIKCMK